MRLTLAALLALVLALFAASLLTGPAGLAPGASLEALLTGRGGAIALVMREIRLPRAILGVLIGGGARPLGRGAAGLSAQPAGRARPLGISGSRRARRGARALHRPLGRLSAGAAAGGARRRGGGDRRSSRRWPARRRRDHADPRRRRRLEPRRRADLARRSTFRPTRSRRSEIVYLAARLARRPLDASTSGSPRRSSLPAGRCCWPRPRRSTR